MIISWSNSITNAHMRKLDCSLEDFMDIFKPENVKEQPTKDGRNYIAGQLIDYTKPRGKGNVIDRCAVVLDCDDADKAGVDKLMEAVRQLGVRSVVHSTYSSTPDKPRVRVVIPLTTVVVPGDYTALCKALMNHLNMVQWDESCAQAERAMYMPAKPEGGDYWAQHTDGPLMNGQEWLKTHEPKARKARTSKGNVAKRDHKRKPENDPGIQGAFNRVYSIEDAIEEFDLPYEPCREGRWTYYGSHTEGGLRLVEGREDLCISEHANSDPACFVDGNGSVRALSAFELCAVHLYGDDDDLSAPPRERASMQKMAKRAGEEESVRVELGAAPVADNIDITWLFGNVDDVDLQATQVAKALQGKLIYTDGLGWVVYNADEGVWKIGSTSAALECIAPVVRSWYYAARLTGDEKFAKSVSKLRKGGPLQAILAHAEVKVTRPVSVFNKDLDLVCSLNGVIESRTGKLVSHDPKYHMTQQVKANYIPGATHPAWDKALEALDPPERAWFQCWIGCALTGYQPDDHGAAVPILTGGGSNGKSVLMTAITRVFGTYAHMGSQALLMPSDGKELLRASAYLMGIRLCYIEEAPDKVLYGNALKQAAATPTMKGEYKFKNEFTFSTTHSLMVSTNNQLRLDEGTNAVMRRLAILPFDYKYVDKQDLDPDKKKRKAKKEKLKDSNLLRELDTPEARSAILAWAVEGAKVYFAAGQHVLPPTEYMKARKSVWLKDADILTGFFGDELIEDPEAMIPWTHLSAAFNDWLKKNNYSVWAKSTLKNRLASHAAFSDFKFGLLRTTGMSLYQDEYGNGPKTPKGGRAVGLRGLRFRTDADAIVEPEGMYREPEPEAPPAKPEHTVAQEQEELIPAEDIPAPTPHAAPEKEEAERQGLIEELDGLARSMQQFPSGHEEMTRLAYETGAVSRQAPLGKLRAFKVRLEGALARLTVQHRKELNTPLAGGSHERRQE